MSAALDWSTGVDPEWDPEALLPAIAAALVGEFGDRFRVLGPMWLRSDPAGLLWLAGPLSVLVVAVPSSLLRFVVTVVVAVGVGLALAWQTALRCHKQRSDLFVATLANEVASVVAVELPPLIVEELSMGHFRPGVEHLILHAANQQAAALRRSNDQRRWL